MNFKGDTTFLLEMQILHFTLELRILANVSLVTLPGGFFQKKFKISKWDFWRFLFLTFFLKNGAVFYERMYSHSDYSFLNYANKKSNHCMFTVPVHSASQSDYSFLNYANKKNQNESMLIKKNQNEWKSFNLPTQT